MKLETTLPLFDGRTFEPAFDADRLAGQYRRVFDVMSSGKPMTLAEIQNAIEKATGVHDSQTGISARIRDFRKEKFGGHWVHSQRRGDAKRGVWEYQLEVRA